MVERNSAKNGISDISRLIDTKRARVHLLNVTVPPEAVIPPDAYVYTNIDKIIREARLVSQDILDRASDILQKQGITCTEKISLSGRPKDIIPDYAEKNSIDLLVLGRANTKILEKAEIPVLVTR